MTKNGLTKLAVPPTLDLEAIKSDKKIEDDEVLKILEQPVVKSTGSKGSKNKKKKKKPSQKAAAEDEESSEEE